MCVVEFGGSSRCTSVPLLLRVIDYHRFPDVCQPASLLLDVIFNIWLFNSMESEVIFAVLHLVLENKTF